MEWQPIATAPKDGTVFLAWIGKRFASNWPVMSACQWIVSDKFSEGGAWHTWQNGFPKPTHWMPLPAAPVGAA